MRIDHYLVAFMVFSLFILGGLFIIGNVDMNYNVGISTDNFNKLGNVVEGTTNSTESYSNLAMGSELYNNSQQVYDQTLGGEVTTTENWESMTKGSYSGTRVGVTSSFRTASNLLFNVADAIGIPPFFVAAALVILTVMLIFAVIYLIRGFKP